jgi:diguanylate cyclase (GGDEF)-like protein/PAS domain S-box-containing protein
MPGSTGTQSDEAPTTVLLVEHDPGDARLVMAALEVSPALFAVEWVDDLGSATAALHAAEYDCLIVDLGLPHCEGLEVLGVLRDQCPDAAVVVLTNEADEAPVLPALHGGVDDYLPKGELSSRVLHRSVQYALERAKLKTELQVAEQSSRELSALVESTTDAVFAKNGQGLITRWNRGAEALYGYRAQDVLGRHVSILHPEGEDESARILATVFQGGTVRGLETVRRTKDGTLVHVSLTVSPLYGSTGEVLGASVIARDIGDRMMLEAALRQQSSHDALTGLPNRAFAKDRLTEALEGPPGERTPVALLFLDLDHFKTVNDAEGHGVGDHLLVEVAQRLRTVVRPGDTVARLGGDEFVIVCAATDTAAAERVATRVSEAIREPALLRGQWIYVTASIGIAVAPPLEADAETLLRHADAAMYEAKARGRARYQFFDVAFAEDSRQRLELAQELRAALARGELDVHYQPVIDIPTGRVLGAEALTRWNHSERGWVPPSVFVALAEDSGFVGELDRWVLRQACHDAAIMRGTGELTSGAHMAVNLSAQTVGDPGLVSVVRESASEARLPTDALLLEVTETALMNDTAVVRRSLEALRGLGAGVALDDFGIGYSSLNLLRQLPVTHLKIDRSFVNNLSKRSEDLAITSSIIDLARALGMQTVAEGVETADQLALLERFGCSTGQGFLWSEAVPIEQLMALPQWDPVS